MKEFSHKIHLNNQEVLVRIAFYNKAEWYFKLKFQHRNQPFSKRVHIESNNHYLSSEDLKFEGIEVSEIDRNNLADLINDKVSSILN